MARRGRWGHLPSAAPDLSATIVSLYEAYENQRDSDIIDAWQNGGEFEDKPVTDQRILEWFQMRRDQMDKQDPMWDYWNDQYQQTQFKIAEQKANLDYVRHQRESPVAANSKMAQFYREWATKLPRASAAWRDLMTSAAKFASASRAAGAAGRSGSATAAMNAQLTQIAKSQIDPARVTMAAVWTAAARMGVMGGSYDNPNYDLSTLGAAELDSILGAISTGGIISADLLREGYTQADINAARSDVHGYVGMPGFDGNLTVPHIIKMLDRQAEGYRRQARVYDRYGYHDQAKTARESSRQVTRKRNEYVVIRENVPDRYLAMNKQYHRDLQDSHDPYETILINQQYADDVQKMSIEVGKDGDIVAAGKMLQESIAARGGDAQGPSYLTDSSSSGPKPGMDLQATSLASQQAIKDAQGLSDGTLVQVIVPDSSRPGEYISQYVPKGTETTPLAGGDTNVLTMPVVHTHEAVRVTDEKGNTKILKGSTYVQMVTVSPVVVDVPSVTDPDAFASPDMISSGSFPGTTSRRVGWRMDYGNGEVAWTTEVNPEDGGWSEEPLVTQQPGAVHSQGMADDKVWHIQMDTGWALAHSAPPTGYEGNPAFNNDPNFDANLEAILSFVPTTTDPAMGGDWQINVGHLLNPNRRPQDVPEGMGAFGGALPYGPETAVAEAATGAASGHQPETPAGAQGEPPDWNKIGAAMAGLGDWSDYEDPNTRSPAWRRHDALVAAQARRRAQAGRPEGAANPVAPTVSNDGSLVWPANYEPSESDKAKYPDAINYADSDLPQPTPPTAEELAAEERRKALMEDFKGRVQADTSQKGLFYTIGGVPIPVPNLIGLLDSGIIGNPTESISVADVRSRLQASLDSGKPPNPDDPVLNTFKAFADAMARDNQTISATGQTIRQVIEDAATSKNPYRDPNYRPPVAGEPPATAVGPTPAELLQTRIDTYNSHYWANIATNPSAIRWANGTLKWYAKNQRRREQLLKTDRQALFEGMALSDPRLLDPNSEAYKAVNGQLDALYVTGPTADMERQYFAQHPGTGFIIPGTNIASKNPDQTINDIVAGVANSLHPWATPNLGTAAGMSGSAGSGAPQAGPITAPQTADLTPTGVQGGPMPGPMAPLGPGVSDQDVVSGAPKVATPGTPAGLTPQVQRAGVKPGVIRPVKPIKPMKMPKVQVPEPPSIAPIQPLPPGGGTYMPFGKGRPGVY